MSSTSGCDMNPFPAPAQGETDCTHPVSISPNAGSATWMRPRLSGSSVRLTMPSVVDKP